MKRKGASGLYNLTWWVFTKGMWRNEMLRNKPTTFLEKLGVRCGIVVWMLRVFGNRVSFRRRPQSPQRLFQFFELFSRFLPTTVRVRHFEPAYFEEQKAYVLDRQRFRSKAARKWLTIWFSVHTVIIFIQTVWGMGSNRIKSLLLWFLPEKFRRLIGG